MPLIHKLFETNTPVVVRELFSLQEDATEHVDKVLKSVKPAYIVSLLPESARHSALLLVSTACFPGKTSL